MSELSILILISLKVKLLSVLDTKIPQSFVRKEIRSTYFGYFVCIYLITGLHQQEKTFSYT